MNETLRIVSMVIGGLVVVGGLGSLAIGRYFGNFFLRPNRQPVIKTPKDYGMKYEDVKIKTEDGVELAAWLMRGTNEKVIILGHPGTFTRYGYSLNHETILKSGYKRDVEFIPAAKHLVDEGYTVLMYDQRNHGESTSTPNNDPHDIPTNVYKDTVAVTKYMSEHPDFKGQDIGLFGICQNSMVNMTAMSREPEALKKAGVKAMTVIQPHGTNSFFINFGLPKFLVKIADWFQSRKASSFDAWNPVYPAKDVSVPTLFMQNVNDTTSDMRHLLDIYTSIPAEKEAIWLNLEGSDDEEKHRFHAYNYFNDHPEQLIAFFNKHLGLGNR